ncbi:Uncharacterised protein at_DN0242 [Pycnogonum litorale]
MFSNIYVKLQHIFKYFSFMIFLHLIWWHTLNMFLIDNDQTSVVERQQFFKVTDDFKIMNKTFKYTINSNACAEGDIGLLILVHSAPNHFVNRDVIRRSWGNPNRRLIPPFLSKVKVVFLLGSIDKYDTDQIIIEEEGIFNGDIVQGNFIDSYRNMTYKHLMGLQWSVQNCPSNKFVLKADDDIFVDTYRLLEHLDGPWNNLTGILCNGYSNAPIRRNKTNKWYVSEEEYPGDTYEEYCAGLAYVISSPIVNIIVSHFDEFEFFWIDDAFVTGTIRKGLNISLVSIRKEYSFHNEDLLEYANSEMEEFSRWNYIFGSAEGLPKSTLYHVITKAFINSELSVMNT